MEWEAVAARLPRLHLKLPVSLPLQNPRIGLPSRKMARELPKNQHLQHRLADLLSSRLPETHPIKHGWFVRKFSPRWTQPCDRPLRREVRIVAP